MKSEDGIYEARRVKKEMDELKKQTVKLKHESVSYGKKKTMIGYKEMFELKSRNKPGILMEENENIERNKEEVDVTLGLVIVNDIIPEFEKENNEIVGNNSRNVSAMQNIIDELAKENREVRGDEFCKESFDVDDFGSDGNMLVEDDVYEMKKVVNEEVGNDSENGSCDVNGIGSGDIDVVLQNVVNEIVKENNDVDVSENASGTVDDTKGVSFIATLNTEKLTTIKSSIVETVRTRVDRKKKKEKHQCL